MTVPLGLLYIGVQVGGAYLGVAAAHAMFDLPVFFASTHVRTGVGQWWSEFVAAFGLLLTVLLGNRFAEQRIAMLIACYITAAYWFTASTSFANPAVTMARAASDTFAGILPGHVLPFIVTQLAGAVVAMLVAHWILRTAETAA